MTCLEEVVGHRPLVLRRRVKWGECDPAGVVYTAVFSDYVIAAAELFYESLFGMPPQRAKRHHGFGTPTRALTFDFRLSLRPDDVFDLSVNVIEVNTRTYTLKVTGSTADGEIIFVSHLTPVCVAREERRSISIPDDFRTALLLYQSECTGASEVLGGKEE